MAMLSKLDAQVVRLIDLIPPCSKAEQFDEIYIVQVSQFIRCVCVICSLISGLLLVAK